MFPAVRHLSLYPLDAGLCLHRRTAVSLHPPLLCQNKSSNSYVDHQAVKNIINVIELNVFPYGLRSNGIMSVVFVKETEIYH